MATLLIPFIAFMVPWAMFPIPYALFFVPSILFYFPITLLSDPLIIFFPDAKFDSFWSALTPIETGLVLGLRLGRLWLSLFWTSRLGSGYWGPWGVGGERTELAWANKAKIAVRAINFIFE